MARLIFLAIAIPIGSLLLTTSPFGKCKAESNLVFEGSHMFIALYELAINLGQKLYRMITIC